LREGLTNVAKHARATRTEVALDVGADDVTLVVRDDGVGLAESTVATSTGLGLRNISERATLLGGQALFVAGISRGTELRWTVPRRPG
jgi:signal transduction histidine kinase